MKRYTVIIPDNHPAVHLAQYLRQAFPLLPGWAIRDAFKRRDIKLDGTRVSPDDMTKPGATVAVFTAFDPSIEIVYEDGQILILNKPAGVSVADDGRGGQTVLTWAQERAKDRYVPRLCHRLDNQTSGLLLLAKTDEAAMVLLSAFKDRSIHKEYTCLVKGSPPQDHAVCKAYLIKDAAHATVKITGQPARDAKPIVTEYQVMERGDISRLKITLITGRTHQIRAHMAFIGHPILGDDKYGDRQFNKANSAEHMKLCAAAMELHVDECLQYLDGRLFSIQAPF
jgi:23S rRNA pseudouridine955/2504/2580 synthase